MPDELTQAQDEDRAVAAPDSEAGSSFDQGLPAEYKPYSTIPWEHIPEESREDVLRGVKEFHGGLTKHQQELAELRKKLPDLERRSQILDQIVKDPRFRTAWEQSQQPSAPQANEEPVNLSEHLGGDAAKAITDMVERIVSQRIEAINGQVTTLRHETTAAKATRELETLRVEADRNGWPSPDEKITEMYNLVAGGVPDITTAYKLAVFDDLPKVVETRTRKSVLDDLAKKQESSVPPGVAHRGTPSQERFSGRDATLKALNAAKRELGITTL